MCIICVSPRKVRQPSLAAIKTMFRPESTEGFDQAVSDAIHDAGDAGGAD